MNRLKDILKKYYQKYGFLFSLLFTFVIIAVFHLTRFSGLKLYPVVVNFAIFWLFFSSLFADETIIQKFARLSEGQLHPKVQTYTKNLTYIWCVYLLFQFVFSFATIFMSDKVWMIFNGCISYVLLGVFFAVEYVFRMFFKRRHNL